MLRAYSATTAAARGSSLARLSQPTRSRSGRPSSAPRSCSQAVVAMVRQQPCLPQLQARWPAATVMCAPLRPPSGARIIPW